MVAATQELTKLRMQAAAAIELRRRKSLERTVYGFVCPEKGLTHKITSTSAGNWSNTDVEPDVYLPAKLEPVVTSKKRFIIVIGGRGSAKSVGVADVCVADTKDNGSKTYFLREYQSSIKNSVHSLIAAEISRFKFSGFDIQKQSILYKDKEAFEFAGLARNVDSVKSAHGFRRMVVEEAQFMSLSSLNALTPTVRNKPKNGLPQKFIDPNDDMLGNLGQAANDSNVSLIFIANPGSSADPFSKRFIEPFKTELDKNGIYEDDLHLVVVMNYTDNPWYEDSGLEGERKWDYENMPRAFYDHQWLGHYNDTVEGAMIKPEWFDAAIDAHIVLGFKPRGKKILTHDPSDSGDPRAMALRHGSVILDVQENEKDDVNDACDWSLDIAIRENVDVYRWDGDGLGLTLKRQISDSLKGKSIEWEVFKGSEGPDNPDDDYEDIKGDNKSSRKNKHTFRNKRAQWFVLMRDRFYRTYRAIHHNDYVDPDKMISISSEIEDIPSLRSEICRIPTVPNGSGMIQVMSKPDMKTKLKLQSPNKADCIMMSELIFEDENEDFFKPLPVKTRGIV